MSDTTRPGANHNLGDDDGVARRAVVRGAAWATPVVLTAVGAPAYATVSGPCTDKGQATLGGSGVVTTLTLSPTMQATVSYAAVRAGKSIVATSDGNTGRVIHTDYTPGFDCIKLYHAPGMKQGDTKTMTITFPRAAKHVTLSITDIDKITGEWIDQVFISPSGYTVTAHGKNVVGTGASGDPFTTNKEAEIHNADGDLTLTWPGPVTQVQVVYRAGDAQNTSGNGQHIGVGLFSYDNCS